LSRAERSCRLSSNALALVLPGGVEAPIEARGAVRLLRRVIGGELLPLTELLVSELVTNSVRHGGAGPDDPVRLEVVVSDHTVRVAVSDLGPGFRPTPQPKTTADGIGGWGLIMVDRSATRWGTREGGRCVWFELERNGRDPTHALVATSARSEAGAATTAGSVG
jgi:anti-sigma regulatory factor (Ser/Thr protein kinase)